tara:strand:- start:276 stop:1106 length:831 start_codon:yes stop_codon:yes gene_type:complete
MKILNKNNFCNIRHWLKYFGITLFRLNRKSLAVFLLCTFISTFFLYFFVSDNTSVKKLNNFSKLTGLVIKEVRLSGIKNTNLEDVHKAINLKVSEPIFLINLKKSKQNLEEIGWIEEAAVSRKLPSTIEIIVTEHKPFAIWQYKNKLALIDRKGHVITRENINKFLQFPLVIGVDAPANAAKIIDVVYNKPKLTKNIIAVTRIGKRRWNVTIDGNIEILLPEKNYKVAWEKLIQLQNEKQILDRKILSIDMRLKDKTTIQLMPGVMESISNRGEST